MNQIKNKNNKMTHNNQIKKDNNSYQLKKVMIWNSLKYQKRQLKITAEFNRKNKKNEKIKII